MIHHQVNVLYRPVLPRWSLDMHIYLAYLSQPPAVESRQADSHTAVGIGVLCRAHDLQTSDFFYFPFTGYQSQVRAQARLL